MHMTLIIEILQAMLRKECNPTPDVVAEVVTHVHLPGSTSYQELPHGYHPLPGLPRLPYQRSFPGPQPSAESESVSKSAAKFCSIRPEKTKEVRETV